MNKVILMGRLTRDPEVRYSQGSEPIAVVRYSLAVNKRFRRQNDTSDADFFNCVAFGKAGEFASRYFQKGQMVAIVGRLSNNTWQDQTGAKRTTTEIIVEEQYFAESKKAFEANKANAGNFAPAPNPQTARPEVKEEESMGFYPVDESIEDDDLPF
jgi:single-strand DNA-binding protein